MVWKSARDRSVPKVGSTWTKSTAAGPVAAASVKYRTAVSARPASAATRASVPAAKKLGRAFDQIQLGSVGAELPGSRDQLFSSVDVARPKGRFREGGPGVPIGRVESDRPLGKRRRQLWRIRNGPFEDPTCAGEGVPRARRSPDSCRRQIGVWPEPEGHRSGDRNADQFLESA